VRHVTQVCYHWVIQSPMFDVSFTEKLLKIVTTRGEILSLKFARLNTVWRPAGEAKAFPRLPSRNKMACFYAEGKRGEGRKGGRERKKTGKKRRDGGRGGEGNGRKEVGAAPSQLALFA